MGRDRLEEVMWASAGSWDPSPETTESSSSSSTTPPKPGEKRYPSYGPAAELGDHGLVAGKFLPFHRGHQYLIDFAKRSCKKLTIAIFVRPGDPVAEGQRREWIARHVADSSVEIHEIATTIGDDVPQPSKFKALIDPHIRGVTHFFTSEPKYQPVAMALGATHVPVDPSRTAIPISGTAIRANLMDNFRYLVPSTRPWFVRRIAVVGAESTGKSTLCARLKEQFGALVVPEWTRVLVEGGVEGGLRSEDIQLAARSQIASEDALAAQVVGSNAGVLLCDTDLRTIYLWGQRLFTVDPPTWIKEQIPARPYDLYLLCNPDIPFKGAADRDLPEHRRAFHDALKKDLANEHVVELTGSRDERFQVAADAIISLFGPTKTLLSRRGQIMV
jgi:HTH-type transcriptional repressor of NAD biosynthesis genes